MPRRDLYLGLCDNACSEGRAGDNVLIQYLLKAGGHWHFVLLSPFFVDSLTAWILETSQSRQP